MKALQERAVQAFLVRHWGVVTRAQATGLGLSPSQIDRAVRTGRWQVVHRGVYRLAGVPLGPQGAALAASEALGPGAVISHRSAALVWGFIDTAPRRPAVTVPALRHTRVEGVEVHRSADLDPGVVRVRRGLRVTEPCRTLIDLGQVLGPSALDAAIDRARLDGLVTIARIEAALAQLSRQGKRGPPAVRHALRRRGFTEGPDPSVLESRRPPPPPVGIPVLGVERTVLDGRYRLDFVLAADVVLEVDGFAYHSSPEAKAADARRRFALHLAGMFVIEADWVLVMRRPGEHSLILAALGRDRRTA